MPASEAADRLLQTGVVGVIPTDTVYGLVARATDQSAVARLYGLKRRESKPGTLIAANIDQLVGLGLKRRYLVAVEHFWPGAVSVIIPATDPSLLYLHQGQQSLAVRVPADKVLLALLQQTGPLLTTSANKPGQPPAENIDQAKNYFGGKVDFYMDGGNFSNHQPSTILQVVDDAINVVRQGAVKIDGSGRIINDV
jgi:L-threonylcarbamoyladenylate synthase